MYDSVHKQVSLSEWVKQATYKQNDGRLLYPASRGCIFAVWVKCI